MIPVEAAFLAIGLMLGFGLGGGLRNLAEAQIRLWPLLPVAVAVQVAPIPRLEGELGQHLPFAALLLSFVLIGVVCAVNWGLRGFPTILLGVMLNAAPIAINQGMPVSAQAVAEVGGSVEEVPTERGGKHHLATEQDRIAFLGDAIPIREPFRAVVSVGDLLMWLGVAGFVIAAMLGRERRREEHPPSHPHRARPSTTSESPR